MEGFILSPSGHSFFGRIGPGLKLCGEVSSASCEQATRLSPLTYIHETTIHETTCPYHGGVLQIGGLVLQC